MIILFAFANNNNNNIWNNSDIKYRVVNVKVTGSLGEQYRIFVATFSACAKNEY